MAKPPPNLNQSLAFASPLFAADEVENIRTRCGFLSDEELYKRTHRISAQQAASRQINELSRQLSLNPRARQNLQKNLLGGMLWTQLFDKELQRIANHVEYLQLVVIQELEHARNCLGEARKSRLGRYNNIEEKHWLEKKVEAAERRVDRVEKKLAKITHRPVLQQLLNEQVSLLAPLLDKSKDTKNEPSRTPIKRFSDSKLAEKEQRLYLEQVVMFAGTLIDRLERMPPQEVRLWNRHIFDAIGESTLDQVRKLMWNCNCEVYKVDLPEPGQLPAKGETANNKHMQLGRYRRNQLESVLNQILSSCKQLGVIINNDHALQAALDDLSKDVQVRLDELKNGKKAPSGTAKHAIVTESFVQQLAEFYYRYTGKLTGVTHVAVDRDSDSPSVYKGDLLEFINLFLAKFPNPGDGSHNQPKDASLERHINKAVNETRSRIANKVG